MHAPEPAIARQPTQATAQLITPAADHVRPEITVRSGRIALHVRRVDMPDIEQAGGCNAAST